MLQVLTKLVVNESGTFISWRKQSSNITPELHSHGHASCTPRQGDLRYSHTYSKGSILHLGLWRFTKPHFIVQSAIKHFDTHKLRLLLLTVVVCSSRFTCPLSTQMQRKEWQLRAAKEPYVQLITPCPARIAGY